MARQRSTRLTLTAAALATGAGALLGGCSSTNLDSIRSNPSPGIMTLSQSDEVVLNQMTITQDTNLRQLNEDLGRMWFYDRPSRMTPRPIPY